MHADLHLHSTASDGEHSPQEVVRRAVQAGFDTLALTDHDSVEGLAQAREAADALGVRLIPGVELSCGAQKEIHILGYGFDTENAQMRDFCARRRAHREERAERIVRRLCELGRSVSLERVRELARGVIARPHIARAMVEAGHVATVAEAFERYLNVGRPAYEPKEEVKVAEAAALIAQAGGVDVQQVLTGFKYIAEQIHLFETTGAHTFMFGFEESYGYLSGTDVRDKDGVNACMLIAEAACWYKKEYGKTLADAIDMLYAQYGYYGDHVTSIVLPGKDGLTRMAEIMQTLRDHPPVAFGDVRVTAVRDYLKSIRTCGDTVEPITLPKSNVMYFELEGGAWICVRPSGTEPKIKLYVNAVTDSHEKTQKLLAYLSDAAAEMIK